MSYSEISEAISNLRLSSHNEKEKEEVAANILREVIRDELFFPENVINRIVDNFFKELKNKSRSRDLINSLANSASENVGPPRVETQSQGSQTLSTGKVLYFKISPS